MKAALLGLFVIVHMICLLGTAQGKSLSSVTTYEVVHSHEHNHDEFHDHEHFEDFDLHDVQNPTEHSKSSHKHEIAVSSPFQYINNVSILDFNRELVFLKLSGSNQVPPRSPFLKGIFRPPIAA